MAGTTRLKDDDIKTDILGNGDGLSTSQVRVGKGNV